MILFVTNGYSAALFIPTLIFWIIFRLLLLFLIGLQVFCDFRVSLAIFLVNPSSELHFQGPRIVAAIFCDQPSQFSHGHGVTPVLSSFFPLLLLDWAAIRTAKFRNFSSLCYSLIWSVSLDCYILKFSSLAKLMMCYFLFYFFNL